MKSGRIAMVVFLVLVLAVPWALAQSKVMMLAGRDFAPRQRPAVKFNHQRHGKQAACFQCHHDYDKYGKNTWEKGDEAACADCHKVKPGKGDNPVPLQLAFHRQCKGCHAALAAKGNRKAPVTCGACHVRGAAPAKAK